MAAETPRWSFLFRSDEGRIDAVTWWRNAALLAAIFAVLTVIWILVEPLANQNHTTEPMFTVPILLANLYRLVYGFGSLILLISYYNLSAKRWRDIGRPTGLAGIVPFLFCFAAALHWLEPRVGGEIPHFLVVLTDIVFFASLIWTVAELGGLLNLRRR